MLLYLILSNRKEIIYTLHNHNQIIFPTFSYGAPWWHIALAFLVLVAIILPIR